MPILMTQASLVPCETQRIGPRTQRCSVLRTKRRVSADPPLESGLSTRNPTLQQARPTIIPRVLHGIRATDTGDLLLEGVNDPDRERGGQERNFDVLDRGENRSVETERLHAQCIPSPDAQEGTPYPDRNPPGTKGRRGGWGERRPLVTHCTGSGDDPLPRRVALGSAATVVTLLPGVALSSVECESQ
jgi:hypothetical protein